MYNNLCVYIYIFITYIYIHIYCCYILMPCRLLHSLKWWGYSMRSSHQDSASHGSQVAMWRRLSWLVGCFHRWKVVENAYRQILFLPYIHGFVCGKWRAGIWKVTMIMGGSVVSWNIQPFLFWSKKIRKVFVLPFFWSDFETSLFHRNQHLWPLGDAHPQALDWLAFAIWCGEPQVAPVNQISSWSWKFKEFHPP